MACLRCWRQRKYKGLAGLLVLGLAILVLFGGIGTKSSYAADSAIMTAPDKLLSGSNSSNSNNSNQTTNLDTKNKLMAQPKLANVASVSTGQQLATAWNDQTVTEIDFTADITSPTTISSAANNILKPRTTDIVVNGNNHLYDLDPAGGSSDIAFELGKTVNTTASFTLSNINIEASPLVSGVINNSPEDTGAVADGGNWYINLNSVNYDSTHADGHTNAGRFATLYQDKVTISGTNNIKTYNENFICGSVDVLPGTRYTGINEAAVSLWFFFDPPLNDEATGHDSTTNIGKNAMVTLSTPYQGNTYGPFYRYYSTVTVNEGAQLNLTGGANAINWHQNSYMPGSFDVKSGGTLYAASTSKNGTYPAINNSDAPGSTQTRGISIEPGGQFFVSGSNAGTPLINFNNPNNFELNIDSPKNFDINNTATKPTYGAINIVNPKNIMNLTNTNLSL